MNDKNKTTLKIILVILLGLALLATLISCCVVGTNRGFKNSVAYATENTDLTFVGLDTVLSSYNGVTFYGIRFNSKEFEDYNYDGNFFIIRSHYDVNMYATYYDLFFPPTLFLYDVTQNKLFYVGYCEQWFEYTLPDSKCYYCKIMKM